MEPSYYTIDELMVVCLSRTINDGDNVFNGVAAALPFAAISLAKSTHAPDAVFFGGLQGAINPVFPFLTPISVDYVYNQFSELNIPVDEIFNLIQRKKLDRIFFGGGQIDKYGNANNTLIGSLEKLKVKLPGGAGASSISCYANNFTLFTTRHLLSDLAKKQKKYTLVEHVDFITTVGHLTPEGTRDELGLQGGGPDWLITDLGVFKFDEQTKEINLLYIHPNITIDLLMDSTGFIPKMANKVDVTPAPTRNQIKIIREIDPLNIRKRLFSEKQLNIRYEFEN